MLITSDIRKSIVFISYETFSPSFKGDGTAFMLNCKGHSWLVTARHIAEEIGKSPFSIRANTGKKQHIDNADWTFHPDDSVDIAVAALAFRGTQRIQNISEDMILTEERLEDYDVGLGNFTYVVGLFHLLVGKENNLPLVHTGHIAMLPSDERIQIQDKAGKIIEVEGYLVQSPGIEGLSGAPVVVRKADYLKRQHPDDESFIASGEAGLLGIWIGAYFSKAAPIAGLHKDSTVPVGFGIVIPAQKIVETVEHFMENSPAIVV